MLTIGVAFFLGFWASYACIVCCAPRSEWARRLTGGAKARPGGAPSELDPLLPDA